jgi:hypothetical protein
MKAIQIVSPADGSISAHMVFEDYATGLEMLRVHKRISSRTSTSFAKEIRLKIERE